MSKKICVVAIISMLLIAFGTVTMAEEPVFLTINAEQVSTWVRNFNPYLNDARYPAQCGMYEPMMLFNFATGEIIPWLATEYAWNEDNTALSFKIRDGVKWSDGEPFSAKDVLFTFNLIKANPALGASVTSILNDYVESFSLLDDSTIE